MFDMPSMSLRSYIEACSVRWNFICRNSTLNEEYRQSQKKLLIQEIQDKKNNLIEEDLDKITRAKNDLIKRFTPKELPPVEYLAQRTKTADKLKLANNEEIEKYLQSLTVESDHQEATLHLLEARERNLNFDIYNLKTKQLNLDKKYLNQPEWKELQKQEYNLNMQKNNKDQLFLDNWEKDAKNILPIDRVLDI